MVYCVPLQVGPLGIVDTLKPASQFSSTWNAGWFTGRTYGIVHDVFEGDVTGTVVLQDA